MTLWRMQSTNHSFTILVFVNENDALDLLPLPSRTIYSAAREKVLVLTLVLIRVLTAQASIPLVLSTHPSY